MNDLLQSALAYVSPFWQGAWGAIRLASGVMVALLLLELVRPGQRLHWRTVLFNAFYTPFYLTLSAMVLSWLMARARPWLPANLLGIAVQDAYSWSAVGLFVAYVVCFDFCYYWFHRAQHTWSFMWRFHLVHHTDSNVAMFSAARHHWMEDALRFGIILAPMMVLFGSTDGIPIWISAFLGLYGLVIHWNMPWQCRALNPWVVTPWYHRIHHSIEHKHYNRNFAGLLPLWDRWFGTYYAPEPGEYPDTGVEGVRHPNSLALLSPWPIPPKDTSAP